MSEAITFDSLCTSVQKYCERSDANFISFIPFFIMNAEMRIATEAKFVGALRTVRGTLTTVSAKPERFKRFKNISYVNSEGKRVFLTKRPYQYCRTFWPDDSKFDSPVHYADYDAEHILIVPSPTPGIQYEIQYYERIQPLDANNQVNYLTQYMPNLILYAVLIEACTFLKNASLAASFQSLYDRAILMLTKEETENLSDDSH